MAAFIILIGGAHFFVLKLQNNYFQSVLSARILCWKEMGETLWKSLRSEVVLSHR